MNLFNDNTYNLNLPGLTLKSATKGQIVMAMLLWLVLAVIVVGSLAFGFMHLWAWFVPVFWPSAPILGYWHSLVTMLLLMAFLRRGEKA